MSLLIWGLIVWGALTSILILVLIYRSTLTRQEDEQLFLDESQSHLQLDQLDIQRQISRINPLVRILSVASGALILVIGGMWVYQGLTAGQ